MTKQDFLEGKVFRLRGERDETTTYRFRKDIGSDDGSLEREYRMTKDLHKILLSDCIMNLEKIGSKKVHLYTFLLGEKVSKSIRYEDMIEFVPVG